MFPLKNLARTGLIKISLNKITEKSSWPTWRIYTPPEKKRHTLSVMEGSFSIVQPSGVDILYA